MEKGNNSAVHFLMLYHWMVNGGLKWDMSLGHLEPSK